MIPVSCSFMKIGGAKHNGPRKVSVPKLKRRGGVNGLNELFDTVEPAQIFLFLRKYNLV